jgi:hypothetical protein
MTSAFDCFLGLWSHKFRSLEVERDVSFRTSAGFPDLGHMDSFQLAQGSQTLVILVLWKFLWAKF